MEKIILIKRRIIDFMDARWKPWQNIIAILAGIILFIGTYFLLDSDFLQMLYLDDFVIRCCLAITHYTGAMFFVLSINQKYRKLQWIIIILIIITDLMINRELFIYAIVAILLTFLIFLGKKGASIFFGAVIHSAFSLLIASLLYKYANFNNESLVIYVCLIISMFIYYFTASGFVNYVINNQFKLITKDKEDSKDLTEEIRNYVYLLYLIGYGIYYINYFSGNIDGQLSDIVNAILITIVAIYQIHWKDIYGDIILSKNEIVSTIKKVIS